LSKNLGSIVMIRIGLALAAVAGAAALVPLVGAAGRSGDPGPVAVAAPVASLGPGMRSGDALALEACLGQKGARLAAKCVGDLADRCVKAAARADETDCYRREGEAWAGLLDEYRGKIDKRLVTDPKRLADLRAGQRTWATEHARRCEVAAPADAALCTMRESGRRVIQFRLIAAEAGVTL
jgi:uncharacterized protein YecT (DUF1311 family)